MKAVILAGGRGTRLAPYTKILPKPLLPIGEMPILEIMLRQMKRSGINDVILTVGHQAQLLQLFFQNGEDLGMQISYSFEEQPLGTAGPLSLVQELNNTFLVTNGDVLTTMELNQLIDYHKNSGAAATIAMHTRQVKVDLGVLQLNGSNEIENYIEKPTYDFQVSMGIYVFEPQVLQYIPYNQYLDFPDLILKLLKDNQKVVGYPYNGYWQDLGRPDDYEQAVDEFEEMRSKILGEEL
ncbi:MAG: sugar phosphate nucleotidyltransferase [Anaerolineales bacterium]